MAQFSQLLISGGFATGVIRYRDYYPGQDQAARIVLPVVIAGRWPVPVIADTGAPWCIFNPEMIIDLDFSGAANYAPEIVLTVRGIGYPGRLLRMDITLPADEGENFDIDATVFVPLLSSGETWPHPNFIGLDGFLNRIRFAVDPAENAFYFGPME